MPKEKSRVTYTPENLDQALEELRNNGSLREVAKKYGIPKSTLHFKLKNPGHKTTLGPSTILSVEEEAFLENWILELNKKGFPLKKEDLQSSVQKFLADNPRPNPFKNNCPGEGWIRAFMRRHPSIKFKTKLRSEGGTHTSVYVSEQDVRKWFAEIHLYLIERDLMDVLNDPRRVFNGAETAFRLFPQSGKLLSLNDKKELTGFDYDNSREIISMVLSFSASGEAFPPMLVYKQSNIPHELTDGLPGGWSAGQTESGRMTPEIFFEYLRDIFYPSLQEKIIPLPVIYFLDGNRTPITYEISELCKELRIELIALYPNAIKVLQPAYVGVFQPVKMAWKEVSTAWRRENAGQEISKKQFATVLDMALKKSLKVSTLKYSFKMCGLVPFNPDAVDYKKCLPNSSQNVFIMPKNNQSVSHLESTISFSQFLDAVGPAKYEELLQTQNMEEANEDFQILHKLYMLFHHSNDILDTDNSETTDLNDSVTLESEHPDSSAALEEIQASFNVPVSTFEFAEIIQTDTH
ncbi:uncharacterized protein LOC129969677 [Argiope bruennichi]|uniref:HTH CENPB-type domain-containing protein n=1 Tax=Argiope bruennichi TaxID=94029 RepID=A0A8T0FSP9_ARGBR|nr:uncharacterized protein LOC129969677 [Argiope bruennichi]XP_055940311.1 uncharacterized protein LOC129969677 [Argiope bruennichi]XP_055940312.1 uncharacterized protein LOC129969677 [Argiope bruennichi]KAF8792530.1 hypothetical protein HNY73_004114 [Argiope bruennichi]